MPLWFKLPKGLETSGGAAATLYAPKNDVAYRAIKSNTPQTGYFTQKIFLDSLR